jgi:hypothetical protein
MFGSRLRKARLALAAALAERDGYLTQRDIALGERNELRRQLDEMIGERNEFRRQLDAVLTTQAQGIRRSSHEPELSRSPQRSLFLASLPKSGTEFVGGAIRDTTHLISPRHHWDDAFNRAYFSGYCNRDDVVSTGVFVSERLLLETISRLTHGYLHQSHCGATYHNLCVLRDAGFERATVLVRDPRDSTVSWTHHLRGMGPGMVNFNSLAQYLPLDYFRWPHEAQLAFQVRTFLPAAVNWIESWVGAAAAASSRSRSRSRILTSCAVIQGRWSSRSSSLTALRITIFRRCSHPRQANDTSARARAVRGVTTSARPTATSRTN